MATFSEYSVLANTKFNDIVFVRMHSSLVFGVLNFSQFLWPGDLVVKHLEA